jgi:chitinase
MVRTSTLAVACLAAASVDASVTPQFGVYYANWARYHTGHYKFEMEDMRSLMTDKKVDIVNYAFAYFCPDLTVADPPTATYWQKTQCVGKDPYSIVPSDPHDVATDGTYGGDYKLLNTDFRALNPSMRTVLSIGGWNYPSSYFSQMVGTKESRTAFVTNIQKWIDDMKFDGVDIDWEFPCSPPRSNPVEMDCFDWNVVRDDGGACTAEEKAAGTFCKGCPDRENLQLLVAELRATLGPIGNPGTGMKVITIAAQAGMPHATGGFNMTGMAADIDYFNVMSYDYTVSDTISAKLMSPNMPLGNTSAMISPQWGVQYTVDQYIYTLAVPAEKLMLGLAYYGHSWYKETPIQDLSWQQFGLQADVMGACCGSFANTYGAMEGVGSRQCGTMMYSEIKAALGGPCLEHYDEETDSNIMYCSGDSPDGHTLAGTWVSYNDQKSMNAIVDFAQKRGLAGAFAFDTSMDTLDSDSKQFTFELSNSIADRIHKW